MSKLLIPAAALFIVCPAIAFLAYFLKSELPKWAIFACIAVTAAIYLYSSFVYNSRNGELFSDALKPWIIGSVSFMLLYLLI